MTPERTIPQVKTPERRSNPAARMLAVLSLLAVAAAVIAIFAFTGDSSDGGKSKGETTAQTTPLKVTPAIRKALASGKYTVRPGDTLLAISAATGVDIEQIERLNPNLDPQTLNAGEQIRLR